MSGFTRGARDFLDLGTWNVYCARCGRKRKATEVVRHWTGTWMCPEHDEPRQPQDFARGIQERMDVPFVQPPLVEFTSLPAGFPLLISPSPVSLSEGVTDLLTETTNNVLDTESGVDITIELAFTAIVSAVLPAWVAPDYSGDPSVVYVESYSWGWASGGSGIQIANPNALLTELQSSVAFASGVLQLTVVDSLGQTAVATAVVAG